jgi:hypothetical protein
VLFPVHSPISPVLVQCLANTFAPFFCKRRRRIYTHARTRTVSLGTVFGVPVAHPFCQTPAPYAHHQLEELSDRVEETDIAVQTDPFLDRAPDPVYIPAKTGVDAETQIKDGELFDFDLESKPIVEVLVGKTIEQAMMEVMEEEELDCLRDHQIKFEELRNAELIETQRLEEQARRRREEKDRRLHQQAEVALNEREASKKIAARSFAQSYLSGLVPSVFQNLEDGGYFYDAQERVVEADFMPWLMDGVDTELVKFARSRAILDAILAQVIKAQSLADPSPDPEVVDEGEPADEESGDEGEQNDDGAAAMPEAGAAEGTEAPGDEADASGGGGDGEVDTEANPEGDGETPGEAKPEAEANSDTTTEEAPEPAPEAVAVEENEGDESAAPPEAAAAPPPAEEGAAPPVAEE